MNELWKQIAIAAIGAITSIITTIHQNRKTRRKVNDTEAKARTRKRTS